METYGKPSGRPSHIDLDELKAIVEADPRQTTRCLAQHFECSHTSIEKHLDQIGKSWKYGVWVPHELTRDQLNRWVDACIELLTCHRTFDWLSNIVTGDEKWVMYINYSNKRQWLGSGQTGVPTPKPELHSKKVMLSVWWGMRWVIYWELLPNRSTVTARM